MNPSLRLACGSSSAVPLALSLLLAVPCLSAQAADPGGPPARVEAGGDAAWRAEAFDPHIVRLWLARDGAATRAVSLAMDAAPTTRAPLTLTPRTEVAGARADTAALSISWADDGRSFSVAARDGGAVLLRDVKIATTPGEPDWMLTYPLAAGERLLGLGQDNRNEGRLDRRGVVRELWAGQQINSGNVTAEYPVPLLIGLRADGRAYGVFFDNVHRLRFDLGATKADELRLDAAGGEIDLYFIDGPKIADVIERYTRLTGRPSLPPLWTLGYWQSKCTYWDWTGLDAAYAQLKERGFPVDVLVLDYDWPEVANNFQWAKRWFADGADPRARIADYARRGVKLVLSQSGPMIRQESETYAPGREMGVFATDGRGNPVECGYYGGKLLDFTHPRIDEWLWPQVARRIGDGVAGWWLDLTEPEGEPPQTVYHAGPAAAVHNQYSQLVTRSFEGVQLRENPDRRPFILTRTGSAGTQAHHAAVWTGDIYSDYATLRAHPPEMLNSGLSGLVWWTNDTGGFMEGYYKNDQLGAHARLYERWMQFSVFSPITRAHKAGGLPEPYQFGPAVEQSTRHYLRLRYRLMPYLYTYAWQASRTGLPIVRPLGLEFQDDPKSVAHPGDEYLFGRELLVAPVLHEGATRRAVYFPPGRWIDWDEGHVYEGGREWVVAAPPNRIPVAVRAGAIIPLAPDMGSTGEKPWDPLTLEIFPSGFSEFTLYRDDGESFGYRRGEFTTTRITATENEAGVKVEIVEANKKFTSAVYALRMHLDRAPKAAVAGGEAVPFGWDATTRVLSVELAAGAGLEHGVEIALEDEALPERPAPELEPEALDPRGEVSGAGGRAVPHFYPVPALPTRIKAVNYDKGGEGVAFHKLRPASGKSGYRADDIGLVETADSGGGFVLSGLQAGEWVRYALDPRDGGYFDLTVRVAGAGGGRFRLVALDQDVAVVEVPATGGDDVFTDLRFSNVYLNPGELSILLYVDAPGFALNSLAFQTAADAPSTYAAALGLRSGSCEVSEAGRGSGGRSLLDKLGRAGSGVVLGIVAPAEGPARLRVRHRNNSGQPVSLTVQVGTGAAQAFTVPPRTGNEEWSVLTVEAEFRAGGNRVVINGVGETWASLAIDQVEFVRP